MPHLANHARANQEGLPRAGEILDGKYRIEGLLGSGGMGVVFAATHLRLGQRVAIKMLLPEWVGDAAVAQRFAREGRASVAIRSEHIVRVLDVDESQGRPYLVLEYLEGEDLEEIVATRGALPIPTAIDLILQACEALAEVHASGVIHRDLKPANLFLTYRADGSPCLKVLDFGISKATTGRISGFIEEGTQPLTVMGSPHYMSPEQMQSAADVDARTDLWSLGAILHELLSGKPPFEGESITALCAHVMTEPPPPLTQLRHDVPPALEGVVLRCLEKDRLRRYADVGELARALAGFGSEASRASAGRIARVLAGGGGSVRPPPQLPSEGLSPSPPAAPTARSLVSDVSYPAGIHRPFAGYLLAAAFVGILVGGTAWKLHTQSVEVREAERRAQGETIAAQPSPIPPVPAAAPSGEPAAVSSTAITNAQVPSSLASAAPSAANAPVDAGSPAVATVASATPPPPAPPPVVSAPAPTPPAPPVVAAPSPPPAVHHHHRARPRTEDVEPAFVPPPPQPVVEEPPASPPPPPSATPTTDPNQLFDTRK